jgi:DNA replication protein DnaC
MSHTTHHPALPSLPAPQEEAIPITHRPCDQCRIPVPWETMDFMGIDLSASLPCICDQCSLALTRAREAEERNARITACQAALASCIGERLRQTDIEHPAFNRTAWQHINAAVDVSANRNLVLVGPSGLCKSRMMYLLCKKATWKGYSIQWVTTDQLTILAEDLAKYTTRQDARDKFQKLKYAGRLVIDDIGKTKWDQKTEEAVWTILSHRYDHNRPTWASCNTHPDTLKLEGWFSRDRGAAIVGRILEDAQVFELQHH